MDHEQLENLSLEKLADGAVSLSFLEALSEKILPNIFDINTDAKKERSMALTIRFRPTIDRFGQIIGADVIIDDPKCKLAPKRPIEAHILLGKIDNEYQAKEIRQLSIADDSENSLDEKVEQMMKTGVKIEIVK